MQCNARKIKCNARKCEKLDEIFEICVLTYVHIDFNLFSAECPEYKRLS